MAVSLVFKTPNFPFLCREGARTDLLNNEKKLALDMATNAACASLLKKKQGTGIWLKSAFSSGALMTEIYQFTTGGKKVSA